MNGFVFYKGAISGGDHILICYVATEVMGGGEQYGLDTVCPGIKALFNHYATAVTLLCFTDLTRINTLFQRITAIMNEGWGGCKMKARCNGRVKTCSSTIGGKEREETFSYYVCNLDFLTARYSFHGVKPKERGNKRDSISCLA